MTVYAEGETSILKLDEKCSKMFRNRYDWKKNYRSTSTEIKTEPRQSFSEK